MMTADEAKKVIAEIERDVKSPKKRKEIAAMFSRNIAGKLSQEAVEVYKSYAGIK